MINYQKIYPTLDLHEETCKTAQILIDEFLNDNIILHNKKLCIVHGKGKNVLRTFVKEYLKKDKRVKTYHVDTLNDGRTLLEIKER